VSELIVPELNLSPQASPLWLIDLRESPAAIAWSSCGTLLAGATVTGALVLVEAATGAEIARWEAHEAGILTLAWHPRDAVLASAGKDGCVRFWHITSTQGVLALASVKLHDNQTSRWVEHLSWRPDGRQLAIASGSRVVLCSTLGVVEQTYLFPGGTVGALCWRPVGAQLAVAGYGGVQIHSVLDTRSIPQALKLKGSLLALAWSPDARVIAAGCQDNTVHFWRLPQGRDARMTGFDYKPLQLCWTHNGRWLVTGGSPLLIFWPFDKGGPEGRLPVTINWHVQAVCAIAASVSKPWLASGCRGGRIGFWQQAGDPQPRAWAELDGRVEQLQWCPRKASGLVAASSRAGILTLWDGGAQ
jgi:WD40 repeat protein